MRAIGAPDRACGRRRVRCVPPAVAAQRGGGRRRAGAGPAPQAAGQRSPASQRPPETKTPQGYPREQIDAGPHAVCRAVRLLSRARRRGRRGRHGPDALGARGRGRRAAIESGRSSAPDGRRRACRRSRCPTPTSRRSSPSSTTRKRRRTPRPAAAAASTPPICRPATPRRAGATSTPRARGATRATGDLAGRRGTRTRGCRCCSACCIPTGPAAAPSPAPVPQTVAVTLPSGQVVTGTLAYRDEFTIALTDASRLVPLVADGAGDASPSTIRCRRTSSSWGSTPMGTCTMCWRTCRRFAEAAFMLAWRTPSVRRPVGAGRARSDCCCSRPPTAGRPITATTRASTTAALTQITPANVDQLALAWAFQTNADAADQGHADPGQRRHLPHGARQRLGDRRAIGPPALALHAIRPTTASTSATAAPPCCGDLVYLTTPDAHLVALDARTGTVRWNVEIADSKRGYWSTNAPLIIRNHLIVGVSGDFDNLPGILQVVRSRQPASCSGRSTARRRRARPARSAAAPPAARCG